MSKRPSRMVHVWKPDANKPVKSMGFPGRNEPCPCGSGAKWKKCGMIKPHVCPICAMIMSLYKQGGRSYYQCDRFVCQINRMTPAQAAEMLKKPEFQNPEGKYMAIKTLLEAKTHDRTV